MELIVHMVYSCPPGGLDGIGGNKGGVCARCLWWSVGKVSTTADSWLVDVALDWHRDKYWQSTEAKIPTSCSKSFGIKVFPIPYAAICCHMLPHSCKNRPRGLLQTSARCARFLLGHMSAYGLVCHQEGGGNLGHGPFIHVSLFWDSCVAPPSFYWWLHLLLQVCFVNVHLASGQNVVLAKLSNSSSTGVVGGARQ